MTPSGNFSSTYDVIVNVVKAAEVVTEGVEQHKLPVAPAYQFDNFNFRRIYSVTITVTIPDSSTTTLWFLLSSLNDKCWDTMRNIIPVDYRMLVASSCCVVGDTVTVCTKYVPVNYCNKG